MARDPDLTERPLEPGRGARRNGARPLAVEERASRPEHPECSREEEAVEEEREEQGRTGEEEEREGEERKKRVRVEREGEEKR